MKTSALLLAGLCLLLAALSGCGGSAPVYADGDYTGRSTPDDTGAFGEVTITIKNGAVTDCRFVTWQEDGSLKDEEYGKVNGEISNQAYYNSAQLAVQAMEIYAEQFVAAGTLDDVDVISAATISHSQFLEAAEEALATAREKKA
ncbi:MAG: FMN-binding protein [Gracilibacteraceae bacterium]|jgi:major membrane immunogen (membrane-anchored lipoprotein)|nr:FMN-binding protein [Gracilibacteraceae bacterium]